MPASLTPPKPVRAAFRTLPYRPAHWVSAKTPMRGGDIVGAQRALADVGHYRPWPDLGFQPVAERRLFEGLKAFQRKAGLAPDGVMGPAGPTAQALDAARHAKATAGARRPSREVLARGANLPLDLSVGDGGANRAADVKAVKAALGLLGYYPPEKARRPDGQLHLERWVRHQDPNTRRHWAGQTSQITVRIEDRAREHGQCVWV